MLEILACLLDHVAMRFARENGDSRQSERGSRASVKKLRRNLGQSVKFTLEFKRPTFLLSDLLE